jgi:Uma2 family endonuclease
MATAATGLMTAEELALLPDDGYQYELVRGVLRRMSPASFRPSNITARLTVRIGSYVEEHGLGEVTGADGGYVLERGPDTVRAPDVAFVRAARVPAPEEQDRFAELAPDLVVEVVSPSDRMKDVEEKVEQYLALGVPLVWVFHPRRRTVTVHRAGREPRVLHEGEELDGEEVLPGFRLAIGDVFR